MKYYTNEETENFKCNAILRRKEIHSVLSEIQRHLSFVLQEFPDLASREDCLSDKEHGLIGGLAGDSSRLKWQVEFLLMLDRQVKEKLK